MLGFDFFWHAGLFSGLHTQPGLFLLPPLTAFTLIPVGYPSFLLMAVLLVWLMMRLKLTGWRQGAVFGLKFGGLMWCALTLGPLSATTADYSLLIGWFVGQTLEVAIAGSGSHDTHIVNVQGLAHAVRSARLREPVSECPNSL